MIKFKANSIVQILAVSLGIGALLFVYLLPRLFRITPIHSGPYDMGSALILRSVEIWQQRSMHSWLATLVQTYPGEANRYVSEAGMHLVDEQGFGFYPSFPAGSAIILHLISLLARMRPSATLATATAASFHLLTSGLVGALAIKSVSNCSRTTAYWAATAAGACFAFSPLNYWMLSYTFSMDSGWYLFWVLALWTMCAGRNYLSTHTYQLALMTLSFCMCYTSFIAVGPLLCLAIFPLKFNQYSFPKTWSSLLCGCLFAFGIHALQYCALVEPSTFLTFLSHILKFRSLGGFSLQSAARIADYLFIAYSIPIIAVVVLLLMLVRHPSKNILSDSVSRWLLWQSFLGPAFSLILFFNRSSEHVYSIIPWSVGISLVFGLAFTAASRIFFRISVPTLFLFAFIMWCGVVSLETFAIPSERIYLIDEALAAAIATEAKDNEVIFAKSDYPLWTSVMLLAKRNIQNVLTDEEARAWLTQHKRTQGIIFDISSDGTVRSTHRLSSY